MKALIIGAGIAAVSAMKAIRKQDPDMEITVYGDEGYFPYRRLRLTKDISQGLLSDALLIQKESWYSENHIRFCKGTGATGLDPAGHRVILSDGTADEYSVLLLANGARSNVLPIKGIGRQGVYSLRTLPDASVILKQAKRSRRILIIGGGVLGLELAWSLNQMGKEVGRKGIPDPPECGAVLRGFHTYGHPDKGDHGRFLRNRIPDGQRSAGTL